MLEILGHLQPLAANNPTEPRPIMSHWWAYNADFYGHPNIGDRHFSNHASLVWEHTEQFQANLCHLRPVFPQLLIIFGRHGSTTLTHPEPFRLQLWSNGSAHVAHWSEEGQGAEFSEQHLPVFVEENGCGLQLKVIDHIDPHGCSQLLILYFLRPWNWFLYFLGKYVVAASSCLPLV